MKAFLTGLLLLVSVAARADYHWGYNQDSYDPVSGFYYKSVYPESERGFLGSKSGPEPTNIAIFNPSTGAVRLLFEKGAPGTVQSIQFETGFKDGSVEFFRGESFVQNNKGVSRRDPKDRLLCVVRSKDDDTSILFVADKAGASLKELVRVPRGTEWHIDVKNSKLRVVRQAGGTIRVESFEW